MTIGIGVGLAEFPFSSAKAFWRWIAMCEDGGVDSFWQTDRLVSTPPFLELPVGHKYSFMENHGA